MFFKGTSSEKKNSQDNLPTFAYTIFFTLHVFCSNLPSKKAMSYVTYPVRERVKVNPNDTHLMYIYVHSLIHYKVVLAL
jgi:hypothetical protein